jgi:hypothetical protein
VLEDVGIEELKAALDLANSAGATLVVKDQGCDALPRRN